MKFYSILEGQTQDVLRRLLRLINKNQGAVNTELAKKATKAELKEVTDVVGEGATPKSGTILARLKGIELVIGDEETAATILYRIKALEDAAEGSGGTETPPAEETEPGEGG